MVLTSAVVVAASPVSLATGLGRAQAALQDGNLTLAASYLRPLLVELPAAQRAINSLKGGAPNLALSQVESLEAALRPAPGVASPARVRAAIGAVYRSPQLSGLHSRPPPSSSLLASLGRLLLQLLSGLFHLVGRPVWLLLALAILILGTLLAAILLQRARARLPEAVPGAAAATSGSEAESPERLFAAADRLQSQGDFKEAVRLSFQALLISASRRRVLAVDPAWTNSDLLRAAHQVADLEPRLRPLVGQFNAVVYGGRDPGASGCAEFTQACRATALGLPG
jgi:tetratricopeptide (TPR) repeat protein